MKKFLALALSLCLFGCATSSRTPAPVPPKSLGVLYYYNVREELAPFVVEGAKIIIMDEVYACPPEKIVRQFLAEARAQTDLRYRENLWDCENEAEDLMINYSKIFRKYYGEVHFAATAGLIGVAIMQEGIPDLKIKAADTLRFHAMVIARCQGGKWLVYEPTLGTVTEFTGLVYQDQIQVFLIIL